MPGDLVLSCVGQADDTVLLANDIWKLYHLLQLCLEYCQKHCVQLSPTKTKLVMVTADKAPSWIPYNPVRVNGTSIELSDQAEHVGVLRSVKGNMPNILQRISAFKGALGAIMSCGLARGRRTNPVVSLKILALYGTPVLMSGLSSLFFVKEGSVLYRSAVQENIAEHLETVYHIPILFGFLHCWEIAWDSHPSP